MRQLTLPIFAAALFSGCGGDRAAAGSVPVRMYDNAFSPAVLRVPMGTNVSFDNVGRNPHNAVASRGEWSTERTYGALEMPAGARSVVSMDSAGVYHYYCTYHGTPDGLGMAGTLVVGDVAYEPGRAATDAPVATASGAVRRVPAEYPTIQSAVDAARPGDLVLVEPGVYREEVTVTTPSVVIRGAVRDGTIVDGEQVRGNGIVVLADAVAIENLTARNALLNGFFWSGVTGFRGSWLTAYNNGDYGIYAFDSTDGLFEHSYASGSPDAGFYVGQCDPCRTVLRGVTAEHNGLGYSGTNSSGVIIASSIWRNNQAGIVPNTLDSELLPPQGQTTIVANLIADNSNREAPAMALQAVAFGNGVLLAGGVGNVVERNVIVGHQQHGVLVTSMIDRNFWMARGNVVRDNVVRRSGRADLALQGPWSTGNCFDGNRHERAAPAGLESLHGCGRLRLPITFDMVPAAAMLVRQSRAREGDFEGGDWRTQPAPPPQPDMPEARTAAVRPAFAVFDGLALDPARAELPEEGRELRDAPVPSMARAGGGLGFFAGPSSFWITALLPLLMLLAWWIARSRGGRAPHQAVAVALVLVVTVALLTFATLAIAA